MKITNSKNGTLYVLFNNGSVIEIRDDPSEILLDADSEFIIDEKKVKIKRVK